MIIDIYKIKYTDFNLKFIKIGGSNIKTILKNNKSLFESMQLLIKSYLNDSNLNIELINNYYESVGEIFIQEFTSDTLISQQTSDAALQKIILAYLSHLYEDLFNLKNNNWDFINKYKNFYNYDEYLKNYGYSVELGNGKESYNIYDSLVIEVSIFNKYLKNHDTKVFLGGELYGEKWIEEVTLANFKNFSNEEIIEQTVGYFNFFTYLIYKKNVPYESYEILENKNNKYILIKISTEGIVPNYKLSHKKFYICILKIKEINEISDSNKRLRYVSKNTIKINDQEIVLETKDEKNYMGEEIKMYITPYYNKDSVKLSYKLSNYIIIRFNNTNIISESVKNIKKNGKQKFQFESDYISDYIFTNLQMLEFDSDNKFDLFGLVKHSGSHQGGHYTAFVKKKVWKKYDDGQVKDENPTNCETKSRYSMLFYKRQNIEGLINDSSSKGLQNCGNSCYLNALSQNLFAMTKFTDLFNNDNILKNYLNQILNLIEIEFEMLSKGKIVTDNVDYTKQLVRDRTAFEKDPGLEYNISYLKKSSTIIEVVPIFNFKNLNNKIDLIFKFINDKVFYKINSCNKEIQIKFLEIITNIKNKLIDLLAIYNDLSFIHKIEDKDVFYQILDLLVFINDYIFKKN